MKDLFFTIQDIVYASFKPLELLGELHFNTFFVLCIIGGLAGWLKLQNDYNKEAEKNNTLK